MLNLKHLYYCHANIQISLDVAWINSPSCILLSGCVLSVLTQRKIEWCVCFSLFYQLDSVYLVRFHLFGFFSIDSCKAEWLFVLLSLRRRSSRRRGKSYTVCGGASHMYIRAGLHPTTISSAVLPPSRVYRLWSRLFFFSLAVVHPSFDLIGISLWLLACSESL